MPEKKKGARILERRRGEGGLVASAGEKEGGDSVGRGIP